jgi:hypothetical protein
MFVNNNITFQDITHSFFFRFRNNNFSFIRKFMTSDIKFKVYLPFFKPLYLEPDAEDIILDILSESDLNRRS